MKERIYKIGLEEGTCLELAEKHGISIHTLRYRIKHGWRYPEIFEKYEGKTYTIEGKTGTLGFFAKASGINLTTLIERIKAGVPEEELLDPARRPRILSRAYRQKKKNTAQDYKPAPKQPRPEHPKLIEGASLKIRAEKNAGKKIVFVKAGAGSGYYWWDDAPEEKKNGKCKRRTEKPEVFDECD